MAFPPRKGKKPPPQDDFAALLDEEPSQSDPNYDYADEPEGEFDDGSEEDLEMGADPDAVDPLAAGDDMGPMIDPEMAGLASTLGFTEPDQQQALIDLIKLVMQPDDMLGDPAMGAMPLESSM